MVWYSVSSGMYSANVSSCGEKESFIGDFSSAGDERRGELMNERGKAKAKMEATEEGEMVVKPLMHRERGSSSPSSLWMVVASTAIAVFGSFEFGISVRQTVIVTKYCEFIEPMRVGFTS
ncbi:hypothetical protein BHM03_00061325 [Ensete ventricosum]|nr:hypothetical protein BHM03_00061325 [Ensete ventricosum]